MPGKKRIDAGAEGEPSALIENTPIKGGNLGESGVTNAVEDTIVPEVVNVTVDSHVAEDLDEGMCCCVCQSKENVCRCGKCNITLYCSKECQVSHIT